MKKLLLAAALVLRVTAAHANDDSFTGEDWFKYCTSSKKDEKSYCNGYTLGAADMASGMDKAANSGKPTLICFTDAPTSTLIDIGRVWYKNNPKHRHYVAALMLAYAFRDAFPCGDKS